jgi:hypothetical protein
MLNTVISVLLNWFLTIIVIPGMAFIYDVYRLRKENKELKKIIEEFKNAKTKPSIDVSIDQLP